MAIPTLTWNLVGPSFITSGTTQVGFQTKSKAFIMSTLQRLVQSSSYWQVDIQDVTGSATEALVLKPNANYSAISNMRVICTMNVSATLGGAATAQIMQNRNQTATADTVETATANRLYMGFTPNNSGSAWVTGSWNSDKPWGSTVRWSKYWFCNASNDANIEYMYLIESSETLWVGLLGRDGSTTHVGIGCGAIIETPIIEQSDDGAGRVYGMTCVGTQVSTTLLAADTTGPFGHSTTTATDHCGVFIVSGGYVNKPTATGVPNINNWELCTKYSLSNPATSTDGSRGNTVTTENTLVGRTIAITTAQAPYRFVGFARQAYSIGGLPALQLVRIPSGALGYTLSTDTTTAGAVGTLNDTILFSNIKL